MLMRSLIIVGISQFRYSCEFNSGRTVSAAWMYVQKAGNFPRRNLLRM